MLSCKALLVFLIICAGVNGQRLYRDFEAKPGSCPPPLPVRICSQSCVHDSHCFRNEKCCPTNCGGTICTTPVTARDLTQSHPGQFRQKIYKEFCCPRRKNFVRPERPVWRDDIGFIPPPPSDHRLDAYSVRNNHLYRGHPKEFYRYNRYRNYKEPISDPRREYRYGGYRGNRISNYVIPEKRPYIENDYNNNYYTKQRIEQIHPSRPFPNRPIEPYRTPFKGVNKINYQNNNENVPKNVIHSYRENTIAPYQGFNENNRVQSYQPNTVATLNRKENADIINSYNNLEITTSDPYTYISFEPVKLINIETKGERKQDEKTYNFSHVSVEPVPVINIEAIHLDINQTKPGLCPTEPTGKWICSSTCTIDSDCAGAKKCCKNRCGAMVCEKVNVEIIPSVEFPVTKIPDSILESSNINTERTVHYSHNPFLNNANINRNNNNNRNENTPVNNYNEY